MESSHVWEMFNSFDYHQALFENPIKNAILLMDSAGVILDVNRAFLFSFGYDKQDILGQSFNIFFTEEDLQKDLPRRELQTVMDEGRSMDNNYLVNKNHALTWVSGESLLLTNTAGQKYILKIIQDIHAQKEAERSIMLLNDFNEKILGSIEDAVVVLNERYQVQSTNTAALQLFNLPARQSSAFDFSHLLRHLDGGGGLLTLIAGTLKGQYIRSRMELVYGKEGSEERSFEVSCIRLAGDDINYVLLLFHDVSLHKRSEQQREDILHFVVHELNNPLSNIALSLQMMEDQVGGTAGDIKDYLESGKRGVARLKRIIGDLYRSTRIASGNIDLEKTTFAFDEMVDEAIDMTRQLYPLSLIRRKGKAETFIDGDRDKLIRVVNNLLTNAIKYSSENPEIEVGSKKDEHSVILSVTDKGQGIAEDDLHFVFNRFFRSDKTKGIEGLGIGLYLSRRIVEAHHGRIWAESVEGQGSTFYFSLPLMW